MSTSSAGFSVEASASASHRISRPSASVLPISTVRPLRVVTTSIGRIALPETAFSTIGNSTRSRTGSRGGHDRLRQPQDDRGAAHVLLHHLHAGGGLQVEAAGIEAHALADQRHLRRVGIAPADVDQPRRPRAGPADGMDRRVVLGEQRVADDDPVLRPEAFGDLHGGVGQLRRSQIGGRRVDQVARQAHRAGEALDERRGRPPSAIPARPRRFPSSSCDRGRTHRCRAPSRAPPGSGRRLPAVRRSGICPAAGSPTSRRRPTSRLRLPAPRPAPGRAAPRRRAAAPACRHRR